MSDINYFGGEKFSPVFPCMNKEVLTVEKTNNEICILIPVKNDLPTLITINLENKTFNVEGYD